MSQAQDILELLKDGEIHPTTEIVRKVYHLKGAGICRVGARIYDLRQQGYDIQSKTYSNGGKVWCYWLNESKTVFKKRGKKH